MQNQKLISPVIPILLPTDTGNHALSLMEAHHLTSLPLVTEEKYLALVQESELLDWDTPESPLSAADFLHYKPAVAAGGHPYEALRIAHLHNLDVIPVIDQSENYLGAISQVNLLHFISQNSGLDLPGGIIVLEVAPKDYSLTEIAKICENEDVLITSLQLFSNRENGLLEVTLKTNRTDLRALVRSFERYEYRIREVFGDAAAKEDLMNRYQLLMSYIDM